MKKKQAIALLLATVLAGTGTVPYAFVSTVYAGQGNAPDKDDIFYSYRFAE